MIVRVTVDSLASAIRSTPFRVDEVRMGSNEYALLLASSRHPDGGPARHAFDPSTDMSLVRTGVMANILGARVVVHVSKPSNRVVLASGGLRAEWCLIHDSIDCEADVCVARQVLES